MSNITILPPPKKPVRLTARQEQFALGVASGMKKIDAFLAAGFKDVYKGRKSDGPARLLALPHVADRVRQLKAQQAMRLNVTIDSLILEIEEARLLAKRDMNAPAMIAASMSKAKLLGFLDNAPGDPGRTPKPSLIPTEMVEMTEEQWLAKFRPPTPTLQ